MSKEWYKDVPEHGVFCKIENDDAEVLYGIITKDIVNNLTKNELSKIKPTTAQEWWGFAQWQPMETAPANGEVFLVKDKDGKVSECYQSEFGFEYDCITTDDKLYFFGWLPLPHGECND